jgi:hypothetical protein
MVLDEPTNDGLLCYAYNKQQHILHAIADEISEIHPNNGESGFGCYLFFLL